MNLGSIPGRGKGFFSITLIQALGPTLPPIQCVPGVISLGVKGSRREVNHSPPSRAEVKNGGAIPLLPYVFMACCLSPRIT
jgi:hypothetical protein